MYINGGINMKLSTVDKVAIVVVVGAILALVNEATNLIHNLILTMVV